jgi:NtrC-family two-component system response regulator AlgB
MNPPTPKILLRILVVDDDRGIRRMLALCLENAGYAVTAASTAEDALAEAQRRVFDLAFVDLRLGESDGTELLRELRRISPWIRVIIITAFGTIESAVEAMRLGASEYLLKPFDCAQARTLAARYGEMIGMERQIAQYKLSSGAGPDAADSASVSMRTVLDHARSAAVSEATVLLTGESGTGKSLLARAIHSWSNRAAGPFVTVSCPAIPSELFESELFGHRRGAFTGAVRDMHGRVAEADGGTLFLDEIGELPANVQAKLLRFLQDRMYERVGDPLSHTADTRLIAATNRDLETSVRAGTFREDLFYRLNVISLELPPLRERRDDIPALAAEFLHHFALQNRKTVTGFTAAAMELLRAADWPGNIRELRNAIERAVILGSGPELDEHDFSSTRPGSPQRPAAGDALTLEQLQRAHIQAVLATAPSLQEAAAMLGIDQATLWRKRRQFDL